MNTALLPITGYLDRFAHRPGETFTAYVATRAPGPCRARLVRVLGGDPNPAGPGVEFEDLSRHYDHRFAGIPQPIRLGSHATAPSPARDPQAACTWSVIAWCARPGEPRCVMSEEDATASVAITIGAEGAAAHLRWPGGGCSLQTFKPFLANCWHRIWLAVDPATGRVRIGQAAFDDRPAATADAHMHGQTIRVPTGGGPHGDGTVLFAAEHAGAPSNHFDGKLEAPSILAGFLEPWSEPSEVLARWDFSADIETFGIRDLGPQGLHGRCVNMPTRAVVGSGWTGREMCWRHAPAEYGAIQFHAGDLEDCRWQRSFTWVVPKTLRSGAYALHLTCEPGPGEDGAEAGAGQDWLPLYVLPPRQGPFNRVAFLASTFTYQAYANHARGNADESYRARVAAWGAYPHNPDDFPTYGRSTYNRHVDGAGVCFSSRLRPILSMRPGFLTFDDPAGSGLRHYPADTHLLGWLAAKGIRHDIITDEDLDDEGPALLANYRCVVTGTHPEYHTERMLDALKLHTGNGGRLAYLGGNGFYWRIARRGDAPHVIELRRAEGGIRAWAAEPGEYYHQLDGQYGGLWRRNRRAPQALVGVGFSGQGRFEGTHYRRTAASHAPENAWIFAGIEEEVIGDYGLSGGGAAGFEMDRADHSLGTPENAVVLARAEHPPASFVAVPEELLSHLTTVSGDPVSEVMKAEMVYFDTPSGGAVFAAGSITFCGSLWQNGAFDGPVSRLLENVMRRFMN